MALTLVLLVYGGVGVLLAIIALAAMWHEEWSVTSSIVVAVFFYLIIVLWLGWVDRYTESRVS